MLSAFMRKYSDGNNSYIWITNIERSRKKTTKYNNKEAKIYDYLSNEKNSHINRLKIGILFMEMPFWETFEHTLLKIILCEYRVSLLSKNNWITSINIENIQKAYFPSLKPTHARRSAPTGTISLHKQSAIWLNFRVDLKKDIHDALITEHFYAIENGFIQTCHFCDCT